MRQTGQIDRRTESKQLTVGQIGRVTDKPTEIASLIFQLDCLANIGQVPNA